MRVDRTFSWQSYAAALACHRPGAVRNPPPGRGPSAATLLAVHRWVQERGPRLPPSRPAAAHGRSPRIRVHPCGGLQQGFHGKQLFLHKQQPSLQWTNQNNATTLCTDHNTGRHNTGCRSRKMQSHNCLCLCPTRTATRAALLAPSFVQASLAL